MPGTRVQLIISAIGKLKRGPEADLALRYLERARVAGRAVALGDIDVRERPESRASSAAQRKAEEAAISLAGLRRASNCRVIALDESGRSLASADFAGKVRGWRDQGVATAGFLLGGPDGHDDSILARADCIIGFGKMTLPHGLARVVLMEQIYRAITIIAGHPYHRA